MNSLQMDSAADAICLWSSSCTIFITASAPIWLSTLASISLGLCDTKPKPGPNFLPSRAIFAAQYFAFASSFLGINTCASSIITKIGELNL